MFFHIINTKASLLKEERGILFHIINHKSHIININTSPFREPGVTSSPHQTPQTNTGIKSATTALAMVVPVSQLMYS